ncbi:MAG: 3-hydroxyacyl-ACP dehydratase FabZ [Sulfuriflexus sp.]|nr:3-hydroxyacyl-ACP dehydratase FabZ [Sulfuriflexus sp.]
MPTLDIHEVMKHLPHRYPFLLIDRVLDYTPGEFLTALKNVSYNEPYFVGHFEHHPVMPGVLILEAMAQATGIFSYITTESLPDGDSLYYFVGVDKARFKAPVKPGDQMQLHVELIKEKRGIWKFNAEAKVDGKLVTTAEIMCAQRDI